MGVKKENLKPPQDGTLHFITFLEIKCIFVVVVVSTTCGTEGAANVWKRFFFWGKNSIIYILRNMYII